MNELIQVAERQIGDGTIQTVNARDLHAFLEAGKDFSTWIKDRIAKYGFVEHHDYALYLLPNFGEKGQGRSSKEYAISLDMAKELSMVERNDKGKQARQYFIQVAERRAKANVIDITTALADPANLTMSSNEIATLCEKEHKNVIRDIRAMLAELGDGSDLSHVQETKDSRGYTAEISLPKDLTLTLVAGYNVKLRKRIIDRWLELEAKVGAGGTAIPQTLPEALRLAADLAEQKAKAEAQLAIAAPKAEALDRIATPTEGAVCLRVAAKLLQMPEKQFLQFANAKGFIFRNRHSRIWQGYSDKAKAGLVELKLTTVERDDGSSKTVEQALITRAGIAKLAQMLGRGGQSGFAA